MVKVSIVMATYNGSAFVREQVSSILKQDFSNFELLVIDDCSSDGTDLIIESFRKFDDRIVLLRNQQNSGPSHSFERGIVHSSGDYIALVDQDDIWCENHLSVLLEAIGSKSLVHADSYFMYDYRLSNDLFSDLFFWIDCMPEKEKLIYLLFSNYVRGASCLFRSDLKNLIVPFPANLPMHDHWIAFCAMSHYGIESLKTVTSYYRRHDNTVTNEDRFDFERIFNWDPTSFLKPLSASGLLDNLPRKDLLDAADDLVASLLKSRLTLFAFMLKHYDAIFGPRGFSSKFIFGLRFLLFCLK